MNKYYLLEEVNFTEVAFANDLELPTNSEMIFKEK